MLFGRFQRAADAVPALLNVLHGYSQMPKLIRVEGADGIGKSTGIAEPLASELRAKHLDTDKFRCDPGEWTTYIETVRVEAFQNAVREELEAERQVVADSVCLDEVLPESTFGKGFRIYVMQLEPYHDSFWQWGYWARLKRNPPGLADIIDSRINRSVEDYHLNFKPHCQADAVVQLLPAA